MFVYKPRNHAEAAFAVRPCPEIAVFKLGKGCLELVSRDMFVFEIPAASPGRWWRGVAHKVAADVVGLYGGAAWDRNGVIFLAVPRRVAGTVFDLIIRVRPHLDDNWDDATAMALYREGLAYLRRGADGVPIAQHYHTPDQENGNRIESVRYWSFAGQYRAVVRWSDGETIEYHSKKLSLEGVQADGVVGVEFDSDLRPEAEATEAVTKT